MLLSMGSHHHSSIFRRGQANDKFSPRWLFLKQLLEDHYIFKPPKSPRRRVDCGVTFSSWRTTKQGLDYPSAWPPFSSHWHNYRCPSKRKSPRCHTATYSPLLAFVSTAELLRLGTCRRSRGAHPQWLHNKSLTCWHSRKHSRYSHPLIKGCK